MKTLEQARKYHKQVHYLVTCEHCQTTCIADDVDFDNFFGVPEHADNERVWKCPVCGNANIEQQRSLLYGVCDEIGNSIYTQCSHYY